MPNVKILKLASEKQKRTILMIALKALNHANSSSVSAMNYWGEQRIKWLALVRFGSSRSSGPDYIDMTYRRHKPPNGFFLGHLVSLTCIASKAENDEIIWSSVSKNYETEATPANISQKIDAQLDSAGNCRPRIVSTYTFNSSDKAEGGFVACFAYKPLKNILCTTTTSRRRLSFCVSSERMKMFDGPRDSPTLNYFYSGQPGPIAHGAGVKLTCSVVTGKDGDLEWVLAINGSFDVFKSNSDLITSFKGKVTGSVS
ncbi:hypothetical protein ElyMa_003392000 [Elysia marginata]|uniref:Ig-like domain-containing protein n=1 Tax=Elysia marginata TaxID=1093978 RepID=A0AAV4JSI1_9GAST|nr:hypothetical protein ElyMa_003392000 [Elysia marginata]